MRREGLGRSLRVTAVVQRVRDTGVGLIVIDPARKPPFAIGTWQASVAAQSPALTPTANAAHDATTRCPVQCSETFESAVKGECTDGDHLHQHCRAEAISKVRKLAGRYE